MSRELMDPHRVPCKTDLGRQALQGRDFPGTRAQRMFLIMADGRTPMSALAPAVAQLGLDEAALQALAAAGLLAWRHLIPRSAPAQAPAPRAPAPVARATAPAAPVRSLAAAKMYALDLAALMLQGQDQAVREAVREVGSAEQMQQWLEATARDISARAGSERAALFLQRVAALMPAETPEELVTT